MSRIFAAVSLGTVLLLGAAAFGVAVDSSGASNETMNDIAAIFGTGLEISSFLPLVLLIGLVVASLGVMARL